MKRLQKLSPRGDVTIRTGIYMQTGHALPCNRCPDAVKRTCPHYEKGATCALENSYLADRQNVVVTVLEELNQNTLLLQPLIAVLVFAEIRWARAVRYLNTVGELHPGKNGIGLEYNAVAREVAQLEASIRKGMEILGLTPKAMHELRRRTPNTSDLLVAILDAKAKEEQAVIDADFEVEDVDGNTN